MPVPVEAFFLPIDDRADEVLFCLFYPAQREIPLGSILYVHPFAEEMNKSRRMAALQAHGLAQAGYAVLQVDLRGCGDSAGDFGDATWQDWVHDVVYGCHWLARRGHAPLWLWGLRAGCLVAAEAAGRLTVPCNFIFWAPTPSGKLVLQQFLRLKAASDMLAGNAKGITESLRQQLARGATVEVAGYVLAPDLAMGLEQAALAPPTRVEPPGEAARLEWFELSTRTEAALSPVAANTAAQWGEAGFAVETHVVNGASFWQTSEIEQVPGLITATVAAISRFQQPAAA